jgi:hypothetical protein
MALVLFMKADVTCKEWCRIKQDSCHLSKGQQKFTGVTHRTVTQELAAALGGYSQPLSMETKQSLLLEVTTSQ